MAEKLRVLLREEEEMNQVRLEFCNRCHSAIRSETYEVLPGRPILLYKPPAVCPVCKDDQYFRDPSQMQSLPTEKNGLLCRCKDPECGMEFYCRPSWYKKQQSVNDDIRVWMPELIDPDKNKVQRLLKESNTELVA
jgi:hypothetical protein